MSLPMMCFKAALVVVGNDYGSVGPRVGLALALTLALALGTGVAAE
jgi:ribosomal protein S5